MFKMLSLNEAFINLKDSIRIFVFSIKKCAQSQIIGLLILLYNAKVKLVSKYFSNI